MKNFFLLTTVFAVLLCGCAFANKAPKKSNWKDFVRGNVKVTAISMNSGMDFFESKSKKPLLFHQEEIVGQKRISSPKDIKLLKQIMLSLDGSYQPTMIAECEPAYRHGLKFESNGRKVEAILCFHCGESIVFHDGKSHNAYIDSKWLKPLNALYTRNKIRLPDYYLMKSGNE